MTTAENISKTAIVTGATGGMGEKIVADLARDHHVYALGRNSDVLQRLAQDQQNVTAVEADLVTDLLDRKAPSLGLAEVLDLDAVDVVVHAAAIAEKFSVDSAQASDWRRMLDINVVAVAELTRLLLPSLRQAEGDVIFINSGAGQGGYPDNVVYAATKHALYALADGLRKGERTVRVTTIAPGPTDTPMLRGLMGDYDPEHMIDPIEVAKAARAVVDAGPTTQLTEIKVRPRIELADR